MGEPEGLDAGSRLAAANLSEMRKRLLPFLTALSVAVVGLPMASAPAQEQPAQATQQVARAGVAVVDATWHVGSSAGQHASEGKDTAEVDPHSHAFKTRNSYGVQSRLTARAIVVEGTSGDRVALVKTDNYLAQDYLQRRVGQILEAGDSGVTYDHILLSATHNHSSPYHTTPAVGPWLFTDAFDLRMFEYQARQIATAIEQAAGNMVPVQMGATNVNHSIFKGNVPGTQTAEDGTPAGFPKKFGDYTVTVVRFDALNENDTMGVIGGQSVNKAVWVNFGQHPESLDGYDLITADYLAPLERFVGRETGAPLVFSQGDVGSAEGPGDEWRVNEDGTVEAWYHKGFHQAERGARYLADSIIEGFNRIGAGESEVGFSSDFPVKMYSAWIPGPSSHPYPSFGNCRTERTVEGSPGSPTAPDCARPFPKQPQSQQVYDNIKAHGLPVPDHYDAPAFMGVEENLRLRMQAVRLGEVILASCSCESQVDLIKNFESRADDQLDNHFDGYEWRCNPKDPITDPTAVVPWLCAIDDPQLEARDGTSVRQYNFSKNAYDRMLAQIHNDADGWDEYENSIHANSEPTDITKIWGNFTKEELSDTDGQGTEGAGGFTPGSADVIPVEGYKIAVGMGHTGDYLGYTVSYREYVSYDHYRKALTSYGPHTADYMVTRLVWMAAELKDEDDGTDDFADPLQTDPYYKLQVADEARQEATARALGQASSAAYDAWMTALPDDVGPAAALDQPDPIKRFEAATFTWRGGSNAVDNPVVVVQRNTDSGWVDYADQSGEVQTFLDFPNGVQGVADTYTGRQEWKWTANFEAFNYGPRRDIDRRSIQIPDGEYRFVVDGVIRQGGGDVAYDIVSDPFTVSKWDGINVKGIQLADDGTVSFQVAGVETGVRTETPNQPDWPIRYPRTYNKHPLIRAITDDGGARICKRCSFRPWAIGSAVDTAEVTVEGDQGTRTIPATCEISGACRTTEPVYAGETAFVARGGVVDTYGEINGEPSASVQGTKTRPVPTATEASPTETPTEDPVPLTSSVTFTERSEESAQYSDRALIEVSVTDENGQPIQGAEVDFEMVGTDKAWSATTDQDGLASSTIELTDAPGDYQITARYDGSGERLGHANMTSFTIAKEDSALTLAVTGKGSKRQLVAELTDADSPSSGIADRLIEFFAGSDKVGEARTNNNGRASIDMPSRYQGGHHNFEARFAGDDYYKASSANAQT